ncbi:MAG: hypothetical protein JNL38_40380 [Myxococcales bacterium]|nr:hypothetical protein [Myxococcales bacterium]
MGQEIATTLTLGRKKLTGTALLESGEVIFRGEARHVFRAKGMSRIAAEDGALVLEGEHGVARIALGPKAAVWAAKLNSPPSRLDKAGLSKLAGAGVVVVVIGEPDAAFARELGAIGATVKARAKSAPFAFVFAGDAAKCRAGVKSARAMIAEDGAIWVVYPRGQRSFTENDVLATGRSLGLKDVKVMRFSDTDTALKFVVPLDARRGRK